MLRANANLAGLTDAQFNAIADMSRNDENTVIGTRIGELHGQYDADIFAIAGIRRNDGEKSYDYAKRILNDFKAKAESANSLRAQLTAANTKVQDLEAKIAANSGDEQLKQQLKDAKAQVTALQTQLTTNQATFDKAKADYEKNIKDIHVSYAFENATKDLKFKGDLSAEVKNILLASAKSEVLAKGTPDFIDVNGKKVLVLRGADGNILNNPANNLNPYTIEELVKESSIKTMIDTGKQQQGGGTVPPVGGGAPTGTLDLSGAKNQLEADDIIEKHLLGLGFTRDSAEFATKSLELRAENKVNELPIR